MRESHYDFLFLLVAGAGYYGENNLKRLMSPLCTIRQTEHAIVGQGLRDWNLVAKQEGKAKQKKKMQYIRRLRGEKKATLRGEHEVRSTKVVGISSSTC